MPGAYLSTNIISSSATLTPGTEDEAYPVENLFDRHDELMSAVGSVITSCQCEHGCPMCVGPLLEVGPTAKDAALQILDLMDRP